MREKKQQQESPVVRVGQVWADNDPRFTDRRLRVLSYEVRDSGRRLVTDPGKQNRPTHALCAVLELRGHLHPGIRWDDTGRRVSVRLDRFRLTTNGYRLVEDVVDGEAGGSDA